MKPWNAERAFTVCGLWVFATVGVQDWLDLAWLWWVLFSALALLLLRLMWPSSSDD